MPPKPGMMGDMLTGAGPGAGPAVPPPGPEKEEPSLAKVKNLLQQAMDMLAKMGAEDEEEGAEVMPAAAPEPRPPLRTAPGI